MPRPNRPRSISGEAALAKRIKYERERLELTPAQLAELMDGEGCPIQTSAIYRIERGDPPRGILVNELIALARVFSTTEQELLTPVELIQQERAVALAKQISPAHDRVEEAVIELLRVFYEFDVLASSSPELMEFMTHQFDAALRRKSVERALGKELRQRLAGEEIDHLMEKVGSLINEVSVVAGRLARETYNSKPGA